MNCRGGLGIESEGTDWGGRDDPGGYGVSPPNFNKYRCDDTPASSTDGIIRGDSSPKPVESYIIPDTTDDAKESTGLPLSKNLTGSPVSPSAPYGLKDSLNKVLEDSDTGSSFSPQPRKLLWPPYKGFIPKQDIMNSHIQRMQKTTSRKRKHGWDRNLNSEQDHSKETAQTIGKTLETVLNKETSKPFRQTFTSVITLPSKELVTIMLDLFQSTGFATSCMVELALENPTGPGMPILEHTLKIHALSGGMGTKVKKWLLSMNFVEELTSPIYYGGLTSILSKWKLKGEAQCCEQRSLFLLATCIHSIGTKGSTKKLWERLSEDCSS